MAFRSQYLIIFCCFLLGSLSEAVLYAQNRPFERAAELQRRALQGDSEDSDSSGRSQDRREDAGEESADTTPLGVDLASIELISHQDKASMAAAPRKEVVVIDSALPAPVGLSATLTEFIGKPISMALLSDIGKSVVVAWRESDYPLVDVYYPEQNITKGRLQIVVREAILGTKSTEGAKLTREDYLLRSLRVDPEDRINKKTVAEDLDWMNENPVRQVNLVYEKGEADGTTDIVLEVIERRPIHAYASFGNTGVDFTGEQEWSFGVTLNNLGKREHTLGYNYTTDENRSTLKAHSLFYEAYLPWRHIFQLSGAHVTSEALDKTVANTTGLSRQLIVAYKIPLSRPKKLPNLRHYFSFAFDYKSTNTDLIFGGANIFNSDVVVGQYRGLYEFSIPDKTGLTKGSFGIVGSPGNIFENNNDASFGLARLNSEASYFYGYGELERLQRLPADFTLRMRVRGRASENRLSATEQLLAGGYNTVRGYDESIIRGDSGIIGNIELITPPLSLSSLFENCSCALVREPLFPDLAESWNFFVFYDIAAMDISEPLPAEVSQSLRSVGVGLNCNLGENGFARASYGWALGENGVFDNPPSGKFHFGVILTY